MTVPTVPRRQPGPPLMAWAAVAFLIAGVLGAGWLAHWGGKTDLVVVTTRDLAAFHSLSDNDIALRKVARSAVPSGAAQSLDGAHRRYLLRAIPNGQIISDQDLGPTAEGGDASVVIVLSVDEGGATEVRRGDKIDLALAPSSLSAKPVVLRSVLVVDLRASSAGGSFAYLAIPRDSVADVAAVAAQGRTLLLRPP
jgi:hypothetical protein